MRNEDIVGGKKANEWLELHQQEETLIFHLLHILVILQF